MTAKTQAAPAKPRKRNWLMTLGASVTVVCVVAALAHHVVFAALLATGTAGVAALVLRARVARYRSGGRVAARKRRKHQGWAGPRELLRARYAAMKLTRRICPGAGLLDLGTSRRQPVAVCRENSVLYVGVPGAGKTGALACHAADAPALLFCTSTKTGLLRETLHSRLGEGRAVWILNADGYGGIPSTLAWSPLEGCEDPNTAIRRAGDFTAAAPKNEGKGGDGDYWAAKGAELLAVVFHAAAARGMSMLRAREWVRNPYDQSLRDAYRQPGTDWTLGGDLASLLAGTPEYVSSVITTAEAALSWMRDPAMRAAACPLPGHGFSMAGLARSGDSVYLIGKKRPHGSLAPYFAAFGAELFEQLKQYAEETGGRFFPVPATFVLDEMPLTCPLPLHDMLAESREPLVTIIAAAQTLAQLRAKFGDHDGDTIRSACPVEVYFGGEKRIGDLEAVTKVIGDHDTWHDSPADLRSEPLLPPGALRMLGKGKAVILMPECRPVLASLPVIWERRGHKRAGLDHPAFRRPGAAGRPEALPAPQRDALTLALLYLVLLRSARLPLRALEPGRRKAIALPYTPATAEEVPACHT